MITMKLIPFVVLCIQIVKCSDNVQNAKQTTKVQQKYHTPTSETFAVPVAVVYDEGNRNDKAIDIDNGPTKDSKYLETNKSKSKANDELEKSTGSVTNNIKNEKSTKQVPHSGIVSEIPVAVIYDPLPDNLQIRHKAATEKSSSIKEEHPSDIKNEKELKTNARSRGEPKTPSESGDVPKLIKSLTRRSNKRQQRVQKNNVKNVTLTNKDDTTNRSRTTAENKSVESSTRTNANLRKRTQERDPVIPIIESVSYVFSHKGDFHYSYESGDGTKAYERGRLKMIDDGAGEAVVGSFSFIGSDGNDYSLRYTADENGYRPEGDHLPTPPPIPPAIGRALIYLATKTTPEPVTKPSSNERNS